MADEESAWLNAVRQAIDVIYGADERAELTEKWQLLAEHQETVITIYGPYDSGKSSLLKRLLVEDGTQVPAWLTVSARPENYEINEIRSGDLCYHDCPGISSGIEEHDRIANDALAATDALMIVVPPQLMTTRRDHMLAIVGGQFYGLAGRQAFPPGALIMVIAQGDTTGADPDDDADEYLKMRELKRDELGRLLRLAIGKRKLPVHVVIADPYGMNAANPQPTLADYAAKPDLDGIAALRGALHSLAAQRDTLRRSAQTRYWALAASQASSLASDAIANITLAADETSRCRDHLQAIEQQLSQLNEAATTDLKLAIHDQLRSITDSAPAADLESVKAEARHRLGATVDVWAQRWGVQLNQLRRDSAAEITAWAQRPGAAAFDQYLGSLLSEATRGGPSGQPPLAARVVSYSGLWIPQIAYEVFQIHTGMNRIQAQVMLEEMRRPQVGNMGSYFTASTVSIGGDQPTDLQRHLKEVHIAEVVPLLIQLGTLIWSSASEHQQAAEQRERQQQIRADIEDAAEEISSEVLKQSWDGAITEFRNQLSKLKPSSEMVESARETLRKLKEAKLALDNLIKEAVL
jgi:hypothetical protein